MKLRYRFDPASLSGMIEGVANKQFDASIAAVTIAAERESLVDFTEPFYTTGFGIAVPRRGTGWIGIVRGVFSWKFIQAVLALAAVLQYLINKDSDGKVSLLAGRFGRQNYGIALPQGSPLPEPMN